MENEQSNKLRRTTKEINQQRQKEKKKKLRFWLIISIITIIIISIVAFFIYWNLDNKSEKAKVNELDKAIQNKNVDKLSEIIKTKGNNLPKSDAKRMINYLNKEKNKSRYDKQINKIKDTIDNDTQYDSTLGEITDKQGKPIITISKDGVSSFIFKEVAFTPHYQDVYINGKNNDATYQFENKGKDANAVTSGKLTKIGSFMVGDYNVSANKHFKDSKLDIEDSVSGNIHINTDNVNSEGKVVAQEQFPQAWFKVELENTEKLDNDYNLYINDENVPYSKTKTYGKYPTDVSLKVRATGTLNSKTIKTNEVDVKSNKDDSTQTVTLKFDDKAIKKQINKDKAIKKDAQSFFEDYTEQLSKSYKSSSFSSLRKYFKDSDSDVAENIKKQVLSDKKNQYSKPKIESYKKSGDEVTIILKKEDETDKVIKSQYVLEYNDGNINKFKIKSYTDI